MNYDVSVAPCGGYDEEEVLCALRSALDGIGGLDFVRPGMRIAVKLNLVTAMKPDAAATVHPAVVCALVRLLREKGALVVVGDSPGGVYTPMAALARPDLTPDMLTLPEDIADVIGFCLEHRGANAVIDEFQIHRSGKGPFA